MRTTLTLDKDVSIRLRRLQEKRRLSLKEAVNQVLRTGLEQLEEAPRRKKRFRIKPMNLGKCLLPSLDNISGVLDLVEGEDHEMILLDANILIYAKVRTMSEHVRARAWFEEMVATRVRIGLPWPTLLAFLRIVTNPRIFSAAVSLADAWQQVEDCLGIENVWIPQPTERHAVILGPLLVVPGATSKLVPDAHLAALAIEHGLTLQTNDHGFARFPGLDWENPLA